MTITSFRFLSLFALSIPIYYIIPKRMRWLALLGFSAAFFALSVPEPRTGVYLLVSALAAWACARLIEAARAKGRAGGAKLALAAGILVNAGILAALKYNGFLIGNYNRLTGSAVALPDWAVPMGVSFYSFALMGYLLDCYWGEVEAQKNPAKLCLYAGYYPILTSGPILSYRTMRQQLFEPHRFDYERVAFGMQRMLWGLFLKLVISGRLGTAVNAVYAEPEAYPGLFIWFAAGLFMLQLYTDFRGCMDIIAGASECYGVQLPENFRTPFFSRSVQEFWQRWHITLGGWMRDYVLYPVLHSRPWRWMSKKLRRQPKAIKQIPTYLGTLILWLMMGLWHGGAWKYVLGQGLWFWSCTVLAQVFEPLFKRALSLLRINTECFSWHLFQSLRVFFLISSGNIFFRAGSISAALHMMRLGLRFNPLAFFGGVGALFGEQSDLNIAACGLLVLLIVSALSEKKSVRERLAEQNLVFRWLVLLALLFAVLIFGMYGPEFVSQDFIYKGF